MPKNNKKTIKIKVKKKAFKPKEKTEESLSASNKKEPELLEISKNWRKEKNKTKNTLSEKEKKEAKEKYGRGFYKNDEKHSHEGDKKLMMWSGVIFFMTAILFFWILNIKNVLRNDVLERNEDFEWTEVKSEINDIMGEIKENIDNIEFKEAELGEDIKTNNDVDYETMVDLKNIIKDLEIKMNQEQ